MKTKHKVLLGLALGACLTVFTPNTSVARQGKGQPKKEVSQGIDEQDKDQKQRGKSDQGKDKSRGNNANAQQDRGNQNRDNGRNDNNNAANNKTKNQNRSNDDLDQDNEGNAYGKNKGGVSGREFGQQRAAQARLTNEQRRERLDNSVEEGDKKVREARTKIAKARKDLEKDHSGKKLTEAQYNEKKAKIERAERAVQVLEEKVNEGRALGSMQD